MLHQLIAASSRAFVSYFPLTLGLSLSNLPSGRFSSTFQSVGMTLGLNYCKTCPSVSGRRTQEQEERYSARGWSSTHLSLSCLTVSRVPIAARLWSTVVVPERVKRARISRIRVALHASHALQVPSMPW